MMRLPARLTAKLVKVRVSRIFGSAPESPLVYGVDPAEVLHPGSNAPVSREKMRELVANPAPIIWIGDSEPLLHAGVGHFVRAIVQSRHCVFLETDGTLLRRRVHEFQPLAELFLTVRLNALESPEHAPAIEGLRAARMSGFFTVIHSIVREDSDPAPLRALRTFVFEKDIDGWLITAESSAEAATRKTIEARGLIPSTFWRQFSKHVEEALLSQTQGRESRVTSAPLAESSPAEVHEEGVEIA